MNHQFRSEVIAKILSSIYKAKWEVDYNSEIPVVNTVDQTKFVEIVLAGQDDMGQDVSITHDLACFVVWEVGLFSVKVEGDCYASPKNGKLFFSWADYMAEVVKHLLTYPESIPSELAHAVSQRDNVLKTLGTLKKKLGNG